MLYFIMRLLLIISFLFGITQNAIADKEADYDALPPFTTSKVKPNVLIMLDNSGSMKQPMYTKKYLGDSIYHGIFQSDKNYQYNTSTAVDSTPYSGIADAPYNVPIDTSSTGAFEIDTSCDVTLVANNCWSGNFLNWLTTRKIDSARMVLVGGKIENRTEFGPWKIIGNNEPSDKDFTKSDSKLADTDLEDVSPFTDGDFVIASPARKGTTLPSGGLYDPYGKLKYTPSNTDDLYLIVDTGGNTIGEMGRIKNVTHDWKTVTLRYTGFTDPVIVAGPLTFNGSDPSTLRIQNSSTTTFQIKVDEYEFKHKSTHNQRHIKETIYYVALESGQHELPDIDGISTLHVEAKAVSSTAAHQTVFFTSPFPTVPVVLGTTVTNNGSDPVIVRFKNISTTQTTEWLQEEEYNDGPHTIEQVDIIAFEKGEFFMKSPMKKVVIDTADVNEDWTNVYSGDLFVANIQTENSTDPCSLRIDDTGNVKAEEEISEDNEQTLLDSSNDPVMENIGFIYRTTEFTGVYNIAVMTDEEPTGVLHDIQNTVRLGITFYNYQHDNQIYDGETTDGGTLRLSMPRNPFIDKSSDTTFREIVTPVKSPINTLVDAIEHYPLVWGTTPLAENLVEVINYFKQPASDPYEYRDQMSFDPFDVDDDWDPYYYSEYASKAYCAQSTVLIFTDGEPWKDGCIPLTMDDAAGDSHALVDADGDGKGKDARVCDQISPFPSEKGVGDNNLDDVAFWAHNHDLRTLEGDQDLTIYTIGFANGNIAPILVDTAINGGGAAYAAQDGATLKNAFTDIFRKIQNNASSGTAAGVVSQSRTGVGGVYQAVFYQEKKSDHFSTDNKRAAWAGNVHAFFIDEYGYMREDTNNDKTLNFGIDNNNNGIFDVSSFPADSYGDFIVIPDPDETDNQLWNKWYDVNNDSLIDGCVGGTGTPPNTNCDTFALEDLHFVWSAETWLNEEYQANDGSLDTQTQREIDLSSEKFIKDSLNKQRYIFTFLDKDGDMVADSGEQIGFTRSEEQDPLLNNPVPSINWCSDNSDPATRPANFDSMFNILTDTNTIYPYLTLFPSFTDTSGDIKTMQGNYYYDATNQDPYKCLLIQQTARLIDYIRGEDISSTLVIQDSIDSTTNYSSPPFRNRQGDFDNDDSTVETWRLGDIIHSTPTMVAKPSEGYHLLYRDTSYGAFLNKYAKRRAVIYAGANDGMLHAFNGGFFDSGNYEFKTTSDNSETEFELGAELWAYIPYNLLPHLYWLTESDYGKSHTYYADLKPRIFDAKIFQNDTDHPGGWGTVLVGGMRFGGGHIQADLDKADTASWDSTTESFSKFVSATDREMTSAFYILDITNPEKPPTVLGELSFAELGYTTCYPTVVPFGGGDGVLPDNTWYLVFGNGPASSTGTADTASLDTGASTQNGRVYVVNLGDLVDHGQLGTDTSNLSATFYDPFQILDSNSFISDPIAVDYDLDYNADAVYFGTISGDETSGWGGKLRRLVAEDDSDPVTWDGDSVFFMPHHQSASITMVKDGFLLEPDAILLMRMMMISVYSNTMA